LSIADRDKHLVARLATPLLAAGYELVATPGTRSALAALGITAGTAHPLGDQGRDGAPGIANLIRSGAVALVVNTPSMATGALRDALEIRLAAVEYGVLCLTAMETAVASAEALSVRASMSGVSLNPIGVHGLR
jgi:carbamoyl-phosphate synthase large subunit